MIIIIFLCVFFVCDGKVEKKLVKLPSVNPAVLPIIPSPVLSSPPQEVEIMDFYVPSYPQEGNIVGLKHALFPFEGDTILLSCGFKLSENIKLLRIEWFRDTENHQVLVKLGS